MLKQIFITLGLACGMTAGALFYLHNVDTCRALVLQDMKKHAQFNESLSSYTQSQDFLTALTRGR